MQRRCSGDTGSRVALDVPAPELRAGLRIDRIDVRTDVTEVQRVAVTPRADRDRCSHASAGGIRPVTAPGPCVQGIDVSVLASDEEAPASDGRLRPRGGRLRKPKGPLQREVRHLVEVEPSALRGLESEILTAHAPSTPMGAAERVHQNRCALAKTGAGDCGISRDRTSGDELCHRLALRVRQTQSLEGHDPICERRHDRLG